MPPTEAVQLLVNSSGAVAVAGMAFWILFKVLKLQEKKDEQTIRALSGVAQKMSGVEKKVDRVETKVEALHRDHQEDKEIIEKMYNHALTLAKKAKVYAEESYDTSRMD